MIYPKILVAEPEPRRARFLQVSLESAGFEVFQAADIANAWSIIQAQELAVALIDARLPDLRTLDLLHLIRADPSVANLPVLILGEPVFSEQATEWLTLGADDYISRTISSELLKAVVYAKLRRGTVIEPN